MNTAKHSDRKKKKKPKKTNSFESLSLSYNLYQWTYESCQNDDHS